MDKRILVIALAGSVSALWSQPVGLTARELYYEGQPSETAAAESKAKPAVTAAKKTAKKSPVATASRSKSASPTKTSNTATAEVRKPETTLPGGARIVNAALRLGLRYNLLLVDDLKSGRSHEVDPDGNFKTGDCFQVRLRPSRSGRMYVFNQGSSGNWHALLPSVLAPGEPVDVTANQELTVARDHCFQLDDRKGVDKLVIMITDRPEDVHELDRPQPQTQPAETQLALRVKSVFEKDLQLISRDMTIQKIGNSPDDPPNSVYVVKTAATDSDRLVIEIPLRHD